MEIKLTAGQKEIIYALNKELGLRLGEEELMTRDGINKIFCGIKERGLEDNAPRRLNVLNFLRIWVRVNGVREQGELLKVSSLNEIRNLLASVSISLLGGDNSLASTDEQAPNSDDILEKREIETKTDYNFDLFD